MTIATSIGAVTKTSISVTLPFESQEETRIDSNVGLKVFLNQEYGYTHSNKSGTDSKKGPTADTNGLQ